MAREASSAVLPEVTAVAKQLVVKVYVTQRPLFERMLNYFQIQPNILDQQSGN